MEFLEDLSDIEIYKSVDLSRYTTIKLGKVGNIVICKTITALVDTIKRIQKNNLQYHLVGWGSNQIFLNIKDTVLIKLDFLVDWKKLNLVQGSYYLPASASLMRMTSMASKLGLKGWEVFTGIPASFGGAIYMNAGTSLGEIGSLIEYVDILKPDGSIYKYLCNENSFSYRKNNFMKAGEVILGASIKHYGIDNSVGPKIKEYLDYRKRTQPLTTKNCGSVFKNYNENFKAGITIDRLGLKGFGTEDLCVSKKHGNFIENKGEASSEDFLALVERLKLEIERQSGIEFELEAKIY